MSAAPVAPPRPELRTLSMRAQWAQRVLRENLAQTQNRITKMPTLNADVDHLLAIKGSFFQEDRGKTFKVAIVGAGCAGLFTAMIFDHLQEKFGLQVDYKILEANSEERLGGRLYTHKFPDSAWHEYYDVGAMRFPNIDVMLRTFQLFNMLDTMKSYKDPPPDSPARTVPTVVLKDKPETGDLIPYYFNGPNQRVCYNDKRFTMHDPQDFKMSASKFGVTGLPDEIAKESPGKLIQDQIGYYKDLHEKGAAEFWKVLMETADQYSVRQYMGLNFIPKPLPEQPQGGQVPEKVAVEQKASLDYNTIEWLETVNSGNRWYDQAFSEMVLEEIDFDDKALWFCVKGGSQQIARKMAKKVQQSDKIHYGQKVTKMAYPDNKDFDEIDVTVKNGKTERFDAVFNSAPLGAMQHMHLEGLNLNWPTKQAIRSLGYGASCKIGVRFSSMWWITKLGIKRGGQSKTDLPIRCCVYPSYQVSETAGEEVDPTKPGVLLVSYTWSQEAQRIAALISRPRPEKEKTKEDLERDEELKALLYHDLARLHSENEEQYKEMHDLIKDTFMEFFAYDWYADPTTVGAFAYFGPGQFSNMYKGVTQCHGKHIIIGEAASAHHAWVVGALESAVRGVYQFLVQHCAYSKAANDALAAYNGDKIQGPFGPLPADFDRTDDCKYITKPDAKDALEFSPIGEFARWQVILEEWRLKEGREEWRLKKGSTDWLGPTEVAEGVASKVLAAQPPPLVGVQA